MCVKLFVATLCTVGKNWDKGIMFYICYLSVLQQVPEEGVSQMRKLRLERSNDLPVSLVC